MDDIVYWPSFTVHRQSVERLGSVMADLSGVIDDEGSDVRMLRPSLLAIPQFPLPAAYRFRLYRAGDEAIWSELHRIGDPLSTIDDQLFDRQFGSQSAALSQRMFFVETSDGEAAGSITAWGESNLQLPEERGLIHWVIVHPAHRRRGLAKAMMTQAMNCLLDLGYQSAALGTSTLRLWAVKLYLDFGFVPDAAELTDPTIVASWRRLQKTLNHPRLRTILDSTILDSL
jgi:GNAT superfamily N-acetyltransferase